MDFSEFEKKIGYTFKNKELLHEALSHSSYANEAKNGRHSNERLEFLGDSVLSIVVSKHLFTHFKHLPEGELTKIRASLVCEKALFEFSKKIDLGKHIILGKGEENSGGRTRPSIVSDAFEAVIAAIYLDGGMEAAEKYQRTLTQTVLRLSTTTKPPCRKLSSATPRSVWSTFLPIKRDPITTGSLWCRSG